MTLRNPTFADVEMLLRYFPDAAPDDPPWDDIQAELVKRGHDAAILPTLSAKAVMAMLGNEDADRKNGNPQGQADAKADTEKKVAKKRRLTKPAWVCANRYKKLVRTNEERSLKQVVDEYVADNGGSASSIYRSLNDHPEEWRPAEKP